MSTESEKFFINELKLDVKKDKIKKFIINNINKIVVFCIVILLTFISYFLIGVYKDNKIEKYNNKVHFALNSNNVINELNSIYNEKSVPRITKTFVGLKLVEQYNNNDNDKIKLIYEDIFENEKEVFLKYYAGLNLIMLELNKSDLDTSIIDNLINEQSNNINPLQDMVLEQKAIFLMRQNKNDDAKNIINSLLERNKENKNMSERLNKYAELIK